MTSTISPPTQPIPAQTLLADRYILTQVERLTVVFPAVWVAEIIRLDRSHILDLPFYDPLLVGIINHDARITPLIAATRLLETGAAFSLKERLMVVRLNAAAGQLANIGIVVDRAIGGSTRQELPPELFEPSQITTETVLMCPELIPSNLWQPQRWG
jgi:chemotaxis signal transduction protein